MAISTTALAIIGTVAAVAGAGVAAYGSYQASQYQAQIAERNARIARENADRSIQRSQVEQESQDMKAKALLAQQEAEQAASGLSLHGRSAIMTRKSSRELARHDALKIRQAGMMEAAAYKQESENAVLPAQMYRQQAQFSLLEGFINAGSSLISGAQNFAQPGMLATGRKF